MQNVSEIHPTYDEDICGEELVQTKCSELKLSLNVVYHIEDILSKVVLNEVD